MSKYRLSRIIQAEINKLNEEIDLKIIWGQSYKKEARRHKFLVSQFEALSRQETYRVVTPQHSVHANWFGKLFNSYDYQS